MRILHVLDHSAPLHSGYTFRTLSILREQRRRGWETFHLTGPKQGRGSEDGAKEETVDGWQFFRAPPTANLLARLPLSNQVSVIHELGKRLQQIVPVLRPDVIHAHSPALNAIAALQAGQRFGVPVVYEVRAFWEDAAVDQGTSREGGPRYRLSRALESFALRRADAVTTICDGLRQDMLARGIPAQRITVIPNAVDIENFAPGAAPDPALAASLGLEGKRVLGFIGSFYAYEGLPLLLQAMPRLLQRHPDLRLLLVGGGPQDAHLRTLSAALGLDGRVIFTGRVPHDQVQRYYDLVNVLVYPRLPMRLTDLVTPLKPLEAMAQGRLLVASDVGGHRELIEDRLTGWLFKAGEVQSLADTLCELLAAPERWDAMRAAARQFVEIERNWPRSVSRYQQVYGQLTGQLSDQAVQ
ncbi:TIGR04063 family PEP-CTERM/XrtA system glycosyltransferase [Lacisediminimonas profundi]|uniref:TIGR04063 family PEP-CTERM/XrtA system glycosyltransferase n=1 Tax=Lacisediminimonas profundi TaxID=2603856 RepID=UPI00124B8A5B|nr:TIGR04063 family PEP-CTERM/XrtA system glycosyltransferase [Lacisediminimonas profundi]